MKPAEGSTPGSVNVIFIDYGNKERVPLNALVVLDPQFHKVPAQAVQVSLQNVSIMTPLKGFFQRGMISNE